MDSFGQYTGLLNGEQTSTSGYSTTEWSVQYQQPPKVVSILPGQFTKTKVYTNLPRKPLVFVQPSPQEQLSEGSTFILFLLAALLFCAFLMASTIAIVSSFQHGRLTKEEKNENRR